MTRPISDEARRRAAEALRKKQQEEGGSELAPLLQLAGTAAGMYFGGPAGASLGGNLGSLAGSAIEGDSQGAMKNTQGIMTDPKKMEIIQRLIAGTK